MEIQILRKKLLYMSTHRGCKEMDTILGKFAEKHLNHLDENELKAYQELLQLPDQDLYESFSTIICSKNSDNIIGNVAKDLNIQSAKQPLISILSKITNS